MISMNLRCDKYRICKHFGKIGSTFCLFCKNEKMFELRKKEKLEV